MDPRTPNATYTRSMRRIVLFVTILAALALTPVRASAAGQTYYDDYVGDAVFPGVDIQRVAMSYSDDGMFVIGANTDQLIGGNRIAFYLDVDLNTATGWYGHDYALFYEQYISGQSAYAAWWNGSSWQLVDTPTLQYAAGEKSVVLVMNRSDIGWPTAGISVIARGFHAVGVNVSDWAPNSGSYVLDFNATTAVGGVNGPGIDPGTGPDGPAVDAPVDDGSALVASLDPIEAKDVVRSAIAKRTGKRSTITVSNCRNLNPTKVTCRTSARRGDLTWTGRTAVTEYVSGATLAHSWTFRGERIDRACRRAASTKKAEATCVRRVSW